MDEVFRGLLESYICGFSVAEVMWRRTPSGVVPFDVRFRDQRRFRFQEEEEADYGFTMRIATREHPYIGEELPPRKFLVHRYWAQNNGDVARSYSERGGSSEKYIDLKKLCSSLSAQENPISRYTYGPLGESYNACITTGRRQSKTK